MAEHGAGDRVEDQQHAIGDHQGDRSDGRQAAAAEHRPQPPLAILTNLADPLVPSDDPGRVLTGYRASMVGIMAQHPARSASPVIRCPFQSTSVAYLAGATRRTASIPASWCPGWVQITG
jgi:hypothetical protein